MFINQKVYRDTTNYFLHLYRLTKGLTFFRGEKNVPGKVSIYVGSHPDADGHAYKAKKIYEETLHLFKD